MDLMTQPPPQFSAKTVSAIGTIIECFINDRHAFTMRAYDYHGPQMMIRAEQGSFLLQNSAVFIQGEPTSDAAENTETDGRKQGDEESPATSAGENPPS